MVHSTTILILGLLLLAACQQPASSKNDGNDSSTVAFPLRDLGPLDKITYELVSQEQSISSGEVPTGVEFAFHNPQFLGKTWHASILVWTPLVLGPINTLYQKVYRFQGDLSFDGKKVELPSPSDSPWVPLLYTEHPQVKIFRSLDPSASFFAEIQFDPGASGYGYVDRNFYDAGGNALGNTEYGEINSNTQVAVDGKLIVQFGALPSAVDPDQIKLADSFLSLTMLTSGHVVQDAINWAKVDGKLTPQTN